VLSRRLTLALLGVSRRQSKGRAMASLSWARPTLAMGQHAWLLRAITSTAVVLAGGHGSLANHERTPGRGLTRARSAACGSISALIRSRRRRTSTGVITIPQVLSFLSSKPQEPQLHRVKTLTDFELQFDRRLPLCAHTA
jgi:hypothetical protein